MHYSAHDLIMLFLWVAGLCVTSAGTLVAGIIALCVKGKKKTLAIDILLCLATAVIVVFQLAALLPASISKGKTAEAVQFSYRRKADMIALDLSTVTYLDRLDSPWKELAAFEGSWTLKKGFVETKKSIEAMWKKHPDDALLGSRLAIVLHAAGDPSESTLLPKLFGQGSDPLLSFLSKLYASPVSDKPAIDYPSVDEVKAWLPEGWYRDTVLKDYFKKTNDNAHLAELDTVFEKRCSWWLVKYKCVHVCLALFVIVGAAAVVAFFRGKQEAGAALPEYGFRKTYGCFLATAYAQSIAVFVVGVCIGFISAFNARLHQTAVAIPNFSALLTQSSIVCGSICAVLCFYFFVCRSAGVSLSSALLGGSRVRGVGSQLLYAFLGFCSVVLVTFLAHLVFSHLRSGSGGSPSDAMLQFVDSMLTTNLGGVLWAGVWFCILAPFTEELLMRVMIYSWLKARLGIWAAVILSSTIFALIHFRLPLFYHYFAIGAILALVYDRTRSFPIIVGIHSFWNAWAMAQVSLLIP